MHVQAAKVHEALFWGADSIILLTLSPHPH